MPFLRSQPQEETTLFCLIFLSLLQRQKQLSIPFLESSFFAVFPLWWEERMRSVSYVQCELYATTFLSQLPLLGLGVFSCLCEILQGECLKQRSLSFCGMRSRQPMRPFPRNSASCSRYGRMISEALPHLCFSGRTVLWHLSWKLPVGRPILFLWTTISGMFNDRKEMSLPLVQWSLLGI